MNPQELYDKFLAASKAIDHYNRTKRDWLPAGILLYCSDQEFISIWNSNHYDVICNSDQANKIHERAKSLGL